MSEFGSVLKEAGWEVLPPGAYWQEFQFVGEFNTYKAGIHNETGCIELRWFDNPFDEAEAASESCVDEHQVLRIVAAVEGDDEWRTDKPLEGVKYELKTVPHDLRPNKVDILLNCTFDSGLWMDGNGARLGATRVLAWRPCLDAYWEVAK